MNGAAREDLVRVVDLDGAEWLHFARRARRRDHPRHDRRCPGQYFHGARRRRSAPSIWHSPRATPAAW